MERITVCPVCDSTSHRGRLTTIRDGRIGNKTEARIWLCDGCGLEWLGEEHFKTEEYYLSGEYMDHAKLPTNWLDYIAYLKMLIHFLPDFEDYTYIDAGCGRGEFSKLTQGLFQTINIEHISKEAPDISADVVLSFNVIEHVSDIESHIKALYDLANKYILICTPNTGNARMYDKDYREYFYRTQHNWYFDEHNLSLLLDKAGFTDIITGFDDPYGLDIPTREARCNPAINEAYKKYLNQEGLSHYVYAFARKP